MTLISLLNHLCWNYLLYNSVGCYFFVYAFVPIRPRMDWLVDAHGKKIMSSTQAIPQHRIIEGSPDQRVLKPLQ